MKRFLAALMCLCLVVCMLPAQVFAADVTTVTLSFASTAQRTSQTGTQQVWTNEGVVFTNNKAASTNAIIDSSNPVRLYASSEVIVAAPEGMLIQKIEFAASSTTYANDLKNSYTGATVSDKIVTIALADAAPSVTIAKLSKQVRLNSLTVTLVSAAGGDTEEPGEGTIETEPSSSETEPSSSETEPAVSVPPADSTLTIPEAIALGNAMGHNTYTEGKYYVTGVVKNVYNTTYGNMYIQDEAGNELTIYGTYSADGSVRYDAMATKPVAGDTVTIYGQIGAYNGAAQIKNGWLTAHTPAAPVEPDPSESTPSESTPSESTPSESTPSESTPAEPGDAAELTLTFDAEKTNRTEYSTEKQVWEQNGVKVTNEKGSSTSNVGDYAAPGRFYKSSKIVIEVPGKQITKIVIDATGMDAKYATPWVDSIGANATNDNGVITVVFAAPVDSLVIDATTAQIRANSITVTVVASGSTEPSETTPSESTPESSETPSESTPESSETPSESTPESSETPSESTPESSETPSVVPGDYTISFADKANRTEYSSSKQVWEQNNIVVTNEKASSTTNVGDYANPGRFYKGSSLVVEVPGLKISKIVVDASGMDSKYATPWVATVQTVTGASVANNSGIITIEFDTPVDKLEIAATTAQIRAKSMTVTAVSANAPVVPTAPSALKASDAFQAEYANFAADAVLPATYLYKDHTFNVAWAIESTNAAGAYIENGVLKLAQQEEFFSYKLTATISLDADTAEVVYFGVMNGTVYAEEATLSFADTAFRTEFSGEKQVWNQNNILFTNDKAESSSAVADYSNPVRLYKSSSVTVEYPAMLSIVFDCNDEKAEYITNMLSSIDATAENIKSVEQEEDKIVVKFNEAVDSFTVAAISAATRLDSITVSQAGEIVVPETQEITITEAIAIGATMAHNDYTADKYIVTGTVVEIKNATYGNVNIQDADGNILYIHGLYNADGSVRYDAMDPKPLVGDTITVKAVIGNYNGTAQMKNGWVLAGGTVAPDPVEATIADALEKADAQENGKYTLGKYIVTGTIVAFEETENALVYGNVYIEDEAGDRLFIYGLYNADGTVRYDAMDPKPAVGDTITVMGIVGKYNDAPQMKNGWVIEHVVPPVAKVGDQTFTTLAEAFASAPEAYVTLIANVTEAEVMVPQACTLDLNGWTVTADSVLAFGAIVDGSDAEGGIVATNFESSGSGWLPLLDNGTYRFFECNLVALGSKTGNAGVKFGFAINFVNAKAYTLIAESEDAGVTVNMTLTCGETSATYAFDAALLKAYAALHIANPGRQAAMILTVTGLEAVEAGTVLTVSTSVVAAGKWVVYAEDMTYTK